MRFIKSVKALRQLIEKLKRQNEQIGFVPTMGALHEGHLSLIRKCRKENDIVVLSIFVNPAQFGPKEDFGKYPREEKKDKLLAKKEKVDIIFYPSKETMYPTGYLTYVEVRNLGSRLCGKSRPEHFQGVSTALAKLLNIVGPDNLYLGQKDAQQAILLKKMVADLNIPVNVKICSTVREQDGLAMSSRNCYLTEQQRMEAPVLYQALNEAKQKIFSGERSATNITRRIKLRIRKNTSGKIDYIQCVDTNTLIPTNKACGKIMIALAVTFGKTRLIDNIIFSVK